MKAVDWRLHHAPINLTLPAGASGADAVRACAQAMSDFAGLKRGFVIDPPGISAKPFIRGVVLYGYAADALRDCGFSHRRRGERLYIRQAPGVVPPPSGIRTNRQAEAEDACRLFLGALTVRPPNKPAAFEMAKKHVANIALLSRAAFKRAWHDEARPEWKLAGAPKKNQSAKN